VPPTPPPDEDTTVVIRPQAPSSSSSSVPRGATLEIGIPCIISSKRKRFRAYARYIGEVEGERGPWVGVEVPVGESWPGDSLEGRDWNDGSWGGVRYFEISNVGSEFEYGDERTSFHHRRRLHNDFSVSTRSLHHGQKREGDLLSVDRSKRVRSSSPTASDVSMMESRGLFVRPQQVLYVIDAVGADL
jgi:dynactin complex subunit